MNKANISLVKIVLSNSIAIQAPISAMAASINGNWHGNDYDVTIFGDKQKHMRVNNTYVNLKRVDENKWQTQSNGAFKNFNLIYKHGNLYVGGDLHYYYKLHR